ncbi:MAG TPA: Rieske 2Fe-2S domain-containing protein [Vicinamibacteria bacterium]|nr:Rieske 2Fe-2S domain-containing protein [Vicinamibacteria bacterium]
MKELQRHACQGCPGLSSRREAVGRISSAAIATMVGVELWAGSAEAVPVVGGGGAQTGPAGHSYPLPAADSVTIDRATQVIIVRFQQHAYVFNLACPHENTALRWREKDVRFRCPRHESKYKPDGTFVEGRATRNMDLFALKRDGGTLVVDLNRLYRSDQQPQDWAAATVQL